MAKEDEPTSAKGSSDSENDHREDSDKGEGTRDKRGRKERGRKRVTLKDRRDRAKDGGRGREAEGARNRAEAAEAKAAKALLVLVQSVKTSDRTGRMVQLEEDIREGRITSKLQRETAFRDVRAVVAKEIEEGRRRRADAAVTGADRGRREELREKVLEYHLAAARADNEGEALVRLTGVSTETEPIDRSEEVVRSIERAVEAIERTTQSIERSFARFTEKIDKGETLTEADLRGQQDRDQSQIRDLEQRRQAIIARINTLTNEDYEGNKSEIEGLGVEAASLARERNEIVARASSYLEKIGRMGNIEGRVLFNPEEIDQQRVWFQTVLAEIEAQETPFESNWLFVSLLTSYIASIDPIKYREYAKEFRDLYSHRKGLNDYIFYCQKAGGLGDLQGAGYLMPLDVGEALIKQEVLESRDGEVVRGDVAEAMAWFQEMALKVLDKRREAAEAVQAGNNEAKSQAEEEESVLTEEMKLAARGKRMEKRGNDIVVVDYKDAAVKRVAGRLFSVWFVQPYGISLHGSGDFMAGRVMNLKPHLLGEPHRQVLWRHVDQSYMTQPLFSEAHLGRGARGLRKEAGIEFRRIAIDRARGIYCYVPVFDKDKIKSINFLKHRVPGDKFVSSYLDMLVKMDEVRKAILSGTGVNKNPTEENVLALSKALEYIKNEVLRSRLSEAIYRGFIEFKDGRGRAHRYSEKIARPIRDREGNIIYKLDEHGNIRLDEEGCPIPKTEVVTLKGKARCDSEKVFGQGHCFETSSDLEECIHRGVPLMFNPATSEFLARDFVSFLGFSGRNARELRDIYERMKPHLLSGLLGLILFTVFSAAEDAFGDFGMSGGKKKK